MAPGSSLKFIRWMRQRRSGIAVLLALAVLFNTPPLLAATTMLHADSGSHMMMAGQAHHDHNMNMPCCEDGDKAGCACMGHCATPFISQSMLVLHSMGNTTYIAMAQQMPVPYVDSPPLRPPRS